MNANELLNILTHVFFISLGVVTIVDYLRHKDVIRRDIALVFCLFAVLFLFQIVGRIIGQPRPVWVGIGSVVALLLEPYFLLRLVRYLHPVPPIMVRVALVSMIASCAAVILFGSALSVVVTLAIEGYFVVLNAYAMVGFVRGAVGTTGVVRQRLRFAAVGAGLLALILFIAGLQVVIIPLRGIAAGFGQVAAIASAITFYVGFAPPRWLRRVWQLSELNKYLTQIGSKPIGRRVDIGESMTELCHAAKRAIGGIAAGIVQKDEMDQRWVLRYEVGDLAPVGLDDVGVFGQVWQERKPWILRAPANLSNGDIRLLETSGADALLIVPVVAQERTWGLLVVFLKHRSLFIEDDLGLIILLVRQSTILLENGVLIEQLRSYSEQLEQTLHLTQMLYETSRELLGAKGYDQILNAVFRYASKDSASVASLLSVEVDDSGKPEWVTIVARAGVSAGTGSPVGSRHRLADVPFANHWINAPDDVLLVENTLEDARYTEAERELTRRVGVYAAVVMPLAIKGTWIGLISVNWAAPHQFSALDRQFYRALSTLVTTVLENERLRQAEQHALQKLAEQEAHYRLLAENIGDMISQHAPDGTITYVSASSMKLLGYSPEELTGQRMDTLLHPDDLELVNQAFLGERTSEGTTAVYRMRHRQGNYVWVETTSRSVRDKADPPGIVAATRDVTERKRAEAEILRRNRELAVLYGVSRAAQSLNVKQTLNSALQTVTESLGFETCSIYLLDPDGETLTRYSHWGVSDELVKAAHRINVGEGVAGQAALEKKQLVINAADYPSGRLASLIAREGYHSMCSTPLFSSGGIVGVLSLATRNAHAFPPEQLEVLVTLGQILGNAVQNAQLHEALQHELAERVQAEVALQQAHDELELRVRERTAALATANAALRTEIAERKRAEQEIRTLQEITQAVAAAHNFHSALEIALRKVCESTGWNYGEAWIPMPDGTELKCSPAWYGSSEYLGEFRAASEAMTFQPGVGLPGRVWSSRQLEWIPDVSLEPDSRFARASLVADASLGAGIGLPIVADDEVLAVLTFFLFEPREEDPRWVKLVSVVAAQLSSIISRKRAVDEIRRLNAELEQRVIERTERLTSINKELEAFSYSVSHDLRAPLRAIDGFSQALQEDYTESLDADGRQYLARIRAASQRMGQLIDDLLELSRLTRSELRHEQVDLSALACRIAAELREQYPEREVEFEAQDGLVVTGDARLLRVALSNLLGNAWKYTSKLPQAHVEFGATRRDGKTVYLVRDNGAGFDMAYADKLFGVFQRLHATSEFPGNGIGLATVQRIVHRHGGQIWAESAVGQGATFYFSL